MASLSGNASTGESNWEKYVLANPAMKKTDYVVEGSAAALYKITNGKLELIKTLKENTKIKILSGTLKEVGKKSLAQVEVSANLKGYMTLPHIRKPTTVAAKSTTKDSNVQFGLLSSFQKNGMVKTEYKLNTPSATESGETDFMNYINSTITKPIDIIIGSKTFKNICGANKVAGTPKADIVLVSYDKANKKFSEVCFISHKKGKSVKDFGQWSGISESAGMEISNNPLVQKFISDVKKTINQTFKNKDITNTLTVMKEIKGSNSTKLKMMSMYGPDYGKGKYGYNNVNYILQGNPVLTKRNNTTYALTMTGHIMTNGDDASEDGEPVFMAYRKGVKADRTQFGVEARFVIQGKNSRPIHFVIDADGTLNSKK
jgi:hypothetical protein